MRREVMVEVLAEQFIIRGMCSKENASMSANEILQVIEDEGMRPPLADGDTAGYVEDGEWHLPSGAV